MGRLLSNGLALGYSHWLIRVIYRLCLLIPRTFVLGWHHPRIVVLGFKTLGLSLKASPFVYLKLRGDAVVP